jgi:hypothetical protein
MQDAGKAPGGLSQLLNLALVAAFFFLSVRACYGCASYANG